jgi:hypothetical protein
MTSCRSKGHWLDRLKRADSKGRPLLLKAGDVAQLVNLLRYFEVTNSEEADLRSAFGHFGIVQNGDFTEKPGTKSE